MTRTEADEILGYVAQDILSPLALDERPAKEVWLELIGEPFNQLCTLVYKKIENNA